MTAVDPNRKCDTGYSCAGCHGDFCWTCDRPIGGSDAQIKTIPNRYCDDCTVTEAKACNHSYDRMMVDRQTSRAARTEKSAYRASGTYCAAMELVSAWEAMRAKEKPSSVLMISPPTDEALKAAIGGRFQSVAFQPERSHMIARASDPPADWIINDIRVGRKGQAMKSREGINMTQNNSHPHAEEINRIAGLLIAEWERCEPQEGKVNPSRIANFADMARVVVEDYDGCPIHAGQVHGGEADELRTGVEKIMREWHDDDEDHSHWEHALRALLDEVDARDSLAHAELVQLRKEQKIAIATLDLDAGQWVPCVGCHELNEGHPTGSWSGVFRCNLGNGCAECGGIGAVWDRFRDDGGADMDDADEDADALRRELELAKGEISRMTIRPADEVLDAAREYTKKLDVATAERNRLGALLPKCVECGKPAACLGNYDQSCGGEAGTSAEDDYACDDCCGHGNEDGHCWPLADIPGILQTLDINLTETVAENKKLEAQLAAAHAELAAAHAELAAFKDAVAVETISAASKR